MALREIPRLRLVASATTLPRQAIQVFVKFPRRQGIAAFQGVGSRSTAHLGGVEPGVAEQLLDEADIGPVFEHVRDAGAA